MNRTYIKNLGEGECLIKGYVEAIRDKKIMFLMIRDVTGAVQVTIEKNVCPEVYEEAKKLTFHSFVAVTGKCVNSPYVRNGGKEIYPSSLEILSIADVLPIQNDSAVDLRMDYRWIDLRSEQNQLIYRMQTTMTAALRDFLLERDFTEIHTPKLIGAASESGSEVFAVKYFDTTAYLAQSPQFYKQMAMASGLDRIFECGPVFRAEKSYTNKHATEFTGFDLEFSYVTSCEEVMQMEEEMLAFAFARIAEKHGADIERLFGKQVIVPTTPFPRITLPELYAELEKRYGYTVSPEAMDDLTTEAEHLCEKFSMEAYGSEFLFVTEFPAKKRAFYHMRDERGIPMGYDLIWRGCEITTGAVREHRYDVLKAQAEEKGLDKDVEFYLQFFRYGCPPHGGFGIGIDRMTMLFLGLSIKETQFLFRGPNRLTP